MQWTERGKNMAKCVSNIGFCEMHLLSLEATVGFWTQGGPETRNVGVLQ